ncbi:hypothetical protein GGX14DRAFT_564905 [Mycena pura]|uniref:CxC2-like cysteine cluster KDZ transposase-associated domain-containing protein n=1 Tax=Mycena pura TaxID=153505 RepID=A0AAD6YE50_9AGAR|nr:hypothetical protein GGX14DRAFT_564905 [Mycena pura]
MAPPTQRPKSRSQDHLLSSTPLRKVPSTEAQKNPYPSQLAIVDDTPENRERWIREEILAHMALSGSGTVPSGIAIGLLGPSIHPKAEANFGPRDVTIARIPVDANGAPILGKRKHAHLSPSMSSNRVRKRGVYIHDLTAANVATSSASRNVRWRVEQHPAPPPSPEKRAYNALDLALGYDLHDSMFAMADEPSDAPASDHPILPFKRVRNTILDGLLRREGRGPWWTKGCMTEGCLETRAEYRCEDCFGSRFLCKSCIVDRHRDEPLHLVTKWEAGYFQPCSLVSISPSLRFQLGHPPGEDCDFRDGPHKFVVLDNNGIHELAVDICGCIGAPSIMDQLLNIGWFPAAVKEPETCATLSLLRRFHTLNLQGRVPAYDFYNALEVLSDRAGMRNLPDRREQFTLMAREYRHLQMCKRAGRGHDGVGVPRAASSAELVYGIEATKCGELAIPCRACPHPGINLPDGWEKAPPEKAWLYQLMLSEDANFRMKGRDVSTRENDPTLGPGFAYMVEHDNYLKYVSKYADEEEISHCVSFAALWRANNKRAKGLRASGIGSVSCSRHEMFRANGTGDLQRGERYSNMDYLWFSSLMGITLLSIIASYDIACQWFRNFWERMKTLPTAMQLPPFVSVQFKVPKFHLPAHVKKCHAPFAFNYTKFAGRTDGEGVERNWSWLNMIACSISVMGPGAREDTIDDFCGYANWRKTVGLGNSLLRKMALAIPKALLHNRAFRAFTEGLREGHEDELVQWDKDIIAWEVDHSKPCPYDYPEDEDITMEDVRLLIAEEEHAQAEQGDSETNGPGAFILAGLEIEENQTRVRLEVKRRNRTSAQAADLQRRRMLLLGQVKRLRDEQAHFMPGLAGYLDNEPAQPEESAARPEDMRLHLPSSLPASVREAICIAGLSAQEHRLRKAQAHTMLYGPSVFRRKHTSGQAAYTKSQALQSSIEVSIKSAASCYNAARAALLALWGPGEWEQTLRVLRDKDIRGMNERTLNDEEKEDDRKARKLAGLPSIEEERDEFGDAVEPTVVFNLEIGEGSRELSWIWYTAATRDVAADGKLHNDIRIEWAKARARADRWREDLIYLEEEMRRVLMFGTWKAKWWDQQRQARFGLSSELAEGLYAYASEQAARERYWVAKWDAQWQPLRERAQLCDDLVDVVDLIPVEVELDEDVAYGEYEDGEGEADDDLLS